MLAKITRTVDQALLLRNEYLVTENRILRNRLTGRVRLTDGERRTLAEIGKEPLENRHWRKWSPLSCLTCILAWHRQLSDQTVGNILKRQGNRPVPQRKTTTTWHAFIRMHMDVLVATDFFTAEVWTWVGW